MKNHTIPLGLAHFSFPRAGPRAPGPPSLSLPPGPTTCLPCFMLGRTACVRHDRATTTMCTAAGLLPTARHPPATGPPVLPAVVWCLPPIARPSLPPLALTTFKGHRPPLRGEPFSTHPFLFRESMSSATDSPCRRPP
jgi:hypothetical protein